MGRPINKRYLGDAENSIKVTHYRRATGSETAGQDDTYIVRQRSTNSFIVADTSGDWQEELTLVNKDAGSLANGEFRISGYDSAGNAINVTRLYNRTVQAVDDGDFSRLKWSVSTSGSVAVSAITTASASLVGVTTSSVHGLTTGDTVVFQNVVGTTELNGNSYVVTVTSTTAFTLDGTDGDNFTTYVSGGEVLTPGPGAIIDLQDA